MKISTIKYFIMDALKSLKRNKTVSIASVATVAATLFILGVFLLIVFNVNAGVKELGAKLEATVYLKDNVTIADKSAIERALNGVVGVSSIKFEDKNDALNNAKKQFGKDSESLTKGFDKNNPFPTAYVVKVEKPEIVSSVVKAATGLKGIDKINDGREIVDKVIKITNTLKIIGIVLFAILVSVSLFLIGNTIKLTVYSRKKEIGIMKFVGATDWFIRWPFIIEGMLLGISGAIISTGVLYYAYKLVFEKATSALLGITLINPYIILSTTLWQFMLGGLIIGAIGSSISIRKFLIV
ncbi:permease-like cell division protein FtsX [Clostridium estertheticum]|uniref:permease-like cell division protein FtsX n=1 Tax=Clostridium estertheticum TaxID=238834 RepID=UPI001CF44B3C|nr:permease-like cell division protein FtsX [Clostridium estertheticum]MCB2305253.1 permease-like cell division protein FtsX [Clostridium estertheticum]MCB2343477.1 permease-like cell division protein FtsX [Clostridium estertheticum]MCB2348397.1 permease-like cell division protein FtsX [Clostridium estertheticum]WAG47346.1 permease-like cell division protein FtsX [Clostridium estertheticum]